ncbi:uncharacterized protein KGF55_002565 [Candida pseudojiufengensis]|uniref:uncharacterized protein n=1 Tax=Candida pseudojiufengensis TaxID=497109 RepID=UPI002225AE93|nr:uncharacterized protein KGF55_002565 [Candida pseudojiufengensis]KAI5963685.1 hypothetical protein KGF55_002565 [Candida pseudojiufengensis]
MSLMKAAVISGESDPLSVIAEIPIPKINDDEILIKAKAFAINPTDWKHIDYKIGQKGDILGSDVSGIVEQVGSNIKNFKKGDFVSSFICGNVSKTNGAFAEYVAASPNATIKYNHLTNDSKESKSGPINTFDGAASVTLGLVTVGITYSYYFDLGKNKKDGDFILIWGGSTATGILAIQLAKLIYNLKIITTASPKNHEFLKNLGADYTFDYNDPEVVNKIRETSQNKLHFAFDTIAQQDTFQKVYDSTSTTTGDIHIDSLLLLDDKSIKLDSSRNNSNIHWGKTLAYLAIDKFKIMGDKIERPGDLLDYYLPWWNDVLPKYLKDLKHGNLKILKNGLGSVDEGLKLSKKGVSNEKIVFSI